MKSETKKAIQNQWNYSSINKQKVIIRRYFELYGRTEKKEWLIHLAEEFGLNGYMTTS